MYDNYTWIDHFVATGIIALLIKLFKDWGK